MKLPFDPETNSTIISDISYVQPMFIDQEKKWKEMTPDDELNEMVQVLTVVQYSRSLLHRVVSMNLYSISAISAMIKARAVSLNEEQIQNIETETVESIFSKAMKCVIEISKDDVMESVFQKGVQTFDDKVNETTLELLLSWMANIHSDLMIYEDGAIY